MTDEQFAAWLRSLPRVVAPERVEEIEHQHDVERGPYAPPCLTIHHEYGESRG